MKVEISVFLGWFVAAPWALPQFPFFPCVSLFKIVKVGWFPWVQDQVSRNLQSSR